MMNRMLGFSFSAAATHDAENSASKNSDRVRVKNIEGLVGHGNG